MYIYISQPMNLRTNDAIVKERNYYLEKLSEMFPSVEFTELNPFKPVNARLKNSEKLVMLSDSLSKMSLANMVVFIGNWRDARGCKTEYAVAKQYGYNILLLQ